MGDELSERIDTEFNEKQPTEEAGSAQPVARSPKDKPLPTPTLDGTSPVDKPLVTPTDTNKPLPSPALAEGDKDKVLPTEKDLPTEKELPTDKDLPVPEIKDLALEDAPAGKQRHPPPPKLDLPPPPPPPKDVGYSSHPSSPHPKTPGSAPITPSPTVSTYPPRKSSLTPPVNLTVDTSRGASSGEEDNGNQDDEEDENTKSEIHTILDQFHPPRTSSLRQVPSSESIKPPRTEPPPHIEITSPVSAIPPSPKTPLPKPEPDLPFDFHRFLDQLKHRTADPVARFLRSFLQEFSKKQWMVHEQVKIIHDFLTFITGKMSLCEVWRDVSMQEFDNAKEGMEKLVMNRLYTQTFSPAIPPPPSSPPPASRRRRRDDAENRWRRGQHQEDVERDDVLSQKIAIYSWIREEHLDIPPLTDTGKRFLNLARTELLKIGNYRAPRDKIICVLNCCKVIFGLLRQSRSEESADKFLPHLIYVVLRANPKHLVSNVQYILRFRNPDKLSGEAGYYLSSLMGAIQFIETLDRSSLTISDEEFERNVEDAVARIAEKKHEEQIQPQTQSQTQTQPSQFAQPPPPSPNAVQVTTPTSARHPSPAPQPQPQQQHLDEEPLGPATLLRTLQKPLSTIGRIFSDAPATPPPPETPRRGVSPNPAAAAGAVGQSQAQAQAGFPGAGKQTSQGKGVYDAQEAAARQASREVEEARRLGEREEENVIGILTAMFPQLDREVIRDVVRIKEGRVGLAVDACLALSAGG